MFTTWVACLCFSERGAVASANIVHSAGVQVWYDAPI